jgi:hypothetical protein
MIGGRNLSPTGAPARLRVSIDDRIVDAWLVPGGFFLKMLSLPAGFLAGPGDYAPLAIEAIPEGVAARDQRTAPVQGAAADGATGLSVAVPVRADVAIEQFDVESADHVVFGYSDGWHEPEYNPDTGRVWRWTSDRAVIHVMGAAGRPLALTLSGEIEAAARSHVTIRAAGQVVAERDVGRQFAMTETIPAGLLESAEAEIVIETDQTFVPAESSWRSSDGRRLGLRVFECRLTPVS